MKKIFILPLIAGIIALSSVVRAQEVVIEAQEEDMQMTLEQRREEWKLMSQEEKQMRREQLREEQRQRKEARKAIEENDVFVDVSEEEAAGLIIVEEDGALEIDEILSQESQIEEVIVVDQPAPPTVIKSQGNWNRSSRIKFND